MVLGKNLQAKSSAEGNFSIADVPVGKQLVVLSSYKFRNDTIETIVTNGTDDLGTIYIAPLERPADDNSEIPTIVVEDNIAQDDENIGFDAENSGAFYTANGDEFLRTSIFTFGPYRFRARGYANTDIQFNGMPLQNVQTGFAPFSQLGGLNDVLRDRTIAYGLRPNEFSFGSVNGSTYINATAANQRKGGTVSYYLSNRSYRGRVMATYNSGLMKNGWAYSLSASRRWAQQGYVPGTHYDGMSFYGGVSKVIGHNQFDLTALAAPTYRGLSYTAADEAFALAGDHYYNEVWGYQNGKIRNSRVDSIFQPIIVASHTYKPSSRTRWTNSLGYKFGKWKRSRVDMYNAYNPNPTYYRNLPSYYLNGGVNSRPDIAAAVLQEYKNNPGLLQMQFDNMYESNYMNTETIYNVDGIAGNNYTGKRSLYVIGNQVDDLKALTFNSTITHALSDKLLLNGGLLAVQQSDEYYRQVADLMGGDYYVNYNQFAAQQTLFNPSYTQNNLNKPNSIIRTGDKYDYDYILRTLRANLWGQLQYTSNRLDLFGAAGIGRVSFSREGLFKNGLFANNSFGKSPDQSFITFKAKGGGAYRIDEKNSIFAYTAYITDAPTARDTYVAPTNREFTVANPQVSKTTSLEAGYDFKRKGVHVRVTGYATDVKDATLIKRFFNDDPDILSFVNYAMQHVNTRSTGVEFLATTRLYSDLTATAVASIGQSFYTNRPTISIYQDNIPSMTPITHTVYIQNYYLGVGPQSVYSFALRYSPRGYWVNASVNYFDRNYVEINPERRSQLAVDLVSQLDPKWKDILSQERLPGAFVVNLAGGKTVDITRYVKSLDRKITLTINGNIGNLLNNQDIKMQGYEQLRYDLVNQNPYKFPNKYGYAYGLNYGVSLILRF